MKFATLATNKRISKIIAILGVLILAFSVRYFYKQDMKFEIHNFHPVVVEIYQLKAKILIADGMKVLLDPDSRFADLNLHFHPLGYSLLISAVYSIWGESEAALQILSIIVDCLSVLVLILIALEFFSLSVALLAGIFTSLAPNIAIHSVFLFPDSISCFPILLAILFLIKAYKAPKIRMIILCGIFLGLACWLRANVFLIPFFFVPLIIRLFPGGKRLHFVSIFLASVISIVSPITIRNFIVYHHFIPISLGAGQTLLEGIADYDRDKSFNIPATDFGIAHQEAEILNRPDYKDSLFGADGIERDQNRIKRGLKVIAENPLWFASVMFRRALWMIQLERSQTVSDEIPTTALWLNTKENPLIWQNTPEQLNQTGTLLTQNGQIHLAEDNSSIKITSDSSKRAEQFASQIVNVHAYYENILKLSLQLQQGRIRILIRDADSSNVYAFAEINMQEEVEPVNQPLKEIEIPFVSRSENIQIIVINENPSILPSVFVMTKAEIYQLAETSVYWSRPLRIIILVAQKIFKTIFFLPLEILGLILMLRKGRRKEVLIIMAIPLYFFCVQSVFHTEFRYVLVIHYFLFMMGAYALQQVVVSIKNNLLKYNSA